jgi:nematocidal protein AidA
MMSQPQSQPHHDKTLHGVDALLVFDAATLLSRYPDASRAPDAPSLADAECCYCLAPEAGELVASNNGLFRISAPLGAQLRLRPATLALRAEQSVLLTSVLLSDEKTLTKPQLVVHDKAEVFVPGSQDPAQPERLHSLDHFWHANVIAHDSVEALIGATITDRNANVLGCFRWKLVFEISAG